MPAENYRKVLEIVVDELKAMDKQLYTIEEIEDVIKRQKFEIDSHTNGLHNVMIHSPIATVQQLHSEEWIKRKQVCELFNVSRCTLDRCRRLGKIDAVAVPGSQVQKAATEEFPIFGYLYNVNELEKLFGRRQEKSFCK